MNEELKILKEIKNKYKNFIKIKYIVGSFAREDFDKNSDIDIVYSLKKEALKKDAFEIINNLAKIKEELEYSFKRKVDLIDKNALGKIAKKYMKDRIYV